VSVGTLNEAQREIVGALRSTLLVLAGQEARGSPAEGV